MKNIPIAYTKEIRERLKMTHLVIFAVDNEGRQHVSTHGGTSQQAEEAARAGNKLKKSLGWPDDLCNSKPVPRVCENCRYYEVDRGIFTATGWTGDGREGYCHVETGTVRVRGGRIACALFNPRG